MPGTRAAGVADAGQIGAAGFDGVDAATLASRLGVPRVVLFERVTSTLDVAHAMARDGAPAGTLILADEQVAGRGRAGRSWRSAPGSGLWLTLIERPVSSAASEVLSLRVGIALAPLLDRFAGQRVSLKWPNDLYTGGSKLAGTLIETRWRGEMLDWVAVGFGLNVVGPDEMAAAGLAKGVSRLEVLEVVVKGLREACAMTGALGSDELTCFAERDMARGQRCTQPVEGVVRGIDERGALLVDREGATVRVREGSLVLEA